MENLDKYPNVNRLLFNNIFKDKDFENIMFTDTEFILLDDKSLVIGKEKISELQGYIIGQNKDGSYSSLITQDLFEWEISIRDFKRNNKIF